ncbi:transglutaminase-like domain-containing protein [Hyunsoonleella sp. 2307UL5-6]|uniref:transglutaminase-like domain-containing protein n=1 Tax=Hyunsoonleella sp. 2307UL5-6 TaxID=3384768 RepID=UPI0039BC9557
MNSQRFFNKEIFEEMNSRSQRTVRYSPLYESLMHPNNCEVVKVISHQHPGYASKHELHKWIKENSSQTHHLSKCLKGNTLLETVDSIQQFLYNHISYYTDPDNYVMKSPECIWASKKADCMGFTTFASSILLNLGIKHYLRSVITQDKYPHIYVVIPKEQHKGYLSKKAKLKKDYYIIEGTTKTNEKEYYDRVIHDLFMDGSLTHQPDIPSMEEMYGIGKNSNKKIVLYGLLLLGTAILMKKI